MSALKLLRRLDAQATPGPWRVGRYPWTVEADTDGLGPRGQDVGNRVATSDPAEIRAHRSPDNARLIATVRTLLPELIAVVEACTEDGDCVFCDHWELHRVHDLECPLRALDAKAATMEDEA